MNHSLPTVPEGHSTLDNYYDFFGEVFGGCPQEFYEDFCAFWVLKEDDIQLPILIDEETEEKMYSAFEEKSKTEPTAEYIDAGNGGFHINIKFK